VSMKDDSSVDAEESKSMPGKHLSKEQHESLKKSSISISQESQLINLDIVDDKKKHLGMSDKASKAERGTNSNSIEGTDGQADGSKESPSAIQNQSAE